jgi:multidrug efflux pump subunit AcrA (membrane-fusion protein)
VRRAAPRGPAADKFPSVTVVVPARQTVSRTIAATGSLGARVDMPVGIAGEGGQVVQVLVQPGQWVGAGQGTRGHRPVRYRPRKRPSLLPRSGLQRADAALAQNELDRARSLVDRGFVSRADVDRRMAARDAAQARVGVAQAAYNASRARIGRLSINAPAAGLVLERRVEPGQVVGGGSARLVPDRPWRRDGSEDAAKRKRPRGTCSRCAGHRHPCRDDDEFQRSGVADLTGHQRAEPPRRRARRPCL